MKQASIFAFGNRATDLLACSAAVLLATCAVSSASAATATTVGGTSFVNVAPASIYNLYVATTGSDANPGTQTQPFKTISKAAAVAKAGTTVHVAAGTYYGNVTSKVSGTSTARIRFLSDTKWGAKIIGSGTEAMWTNNASYVDIVGFDISGSGRLGVLNNGSNTVVANNHIHNLTISGGCTGSGGSAVVNGNYSSANGDILGNVVHDIGKPGGCNGVQGLYSSNKNGHIINNIVYRVSAYGIHLWHASSGTVIANNTVFANGSTSMGGGIVIGVGDSPGGLQLTNTKVVNNVVYKNPRAGIMEYCYSGQNCIGSGNVVANNLVYGNGSAVTMKVGSATGTVSADPKFVSYNPTGTGDYRLQNTSPAINKGTSSWAPNTDIINTARPQGGAFDIGAYETVIQVLTAATSDSTSDSTSTSTSTTTSTVALPVSSTSAGTGSYQPDATVAGTSTVNVAQAAVYNLYVATTGSDSNAGSKVAPFKTINKAASVAKAGTTIHVAAGTYYGNVTTKVSGTSTNRIRYVSDIKWGAKIIGSGTEAMWTNSASYVDIKGFDISGSGRLGVLNTGSNTVVASNHIHNLTISGGCTGSGGSAIVNGNYSSANGDMLGNVVHDIGKPGGCNGVQGLYSSNKGGHIMNNIVYRASAYGIHLWHAASGTVIANNTVFANGSSSMGGGIVTGVGDSPGGVQLTNTKVINNLVYNNPRSGIMQYCYSGQSCIGSGNVVSNNLVYGNGSAVTMKVGSATGTVSADPKFVSYNPTGTGDYRLQSTSPAINKGTSNSAPVTDFIGIARPLGGGFDIGSYESY